MGIVSLYMRRAWTTNLHWSMEGLDLAIIHIATTVSCAGCDDSKMVGGTAAVAIMGLTVGETSRLPGQGLGEHVTWSWTYSTDCLQFDASCFAILKTAEAMAIYFTNVLPPAALYLLHLDYSALQAITNPCSHSAQLGTLFFHHSLTSLVTLHPHIQLFLVWTPGNVLCSC